MAYLRDMLSRRLSGERRRRCDLLYDVLVSK